MKLKNKSYRWAFAFLSVFLVTTSTLHAETREEQRLRLRAELEAQGVDLNPPAPTHDQPDQFDNCGGQYHDDLDDCMRVDAPQFGDIPVEYHDLKRFLSTFKHFKKEYMAESRSDYQFMKKLVNANLTGPSSTPEGCNALDTKIGFYQGLIGRTIYDRQLSCDSQGDLSCRTFRNDPVDRVEIEGVTVDPPHPETEAQATTRMKRLGCCKAGFLMGMAKLEDALKSPHAIHPLPQECAAAYRAGQHMGTKACAKPGEKVCNDSSAEEAYFEAISFPGCRSQGFIVARANCRGRDIGLTDLLRRYGMRIGVRRDKGVSRHIVTPGGNGGTRVPAGAGN